MMVRRHFTLVLIAAALVLSGLGHYYLLYLEVYARDAIAFYGLAALLMVWAYRRSEAVPGRGRTLVWSALRRLGVVLREVFVRRGPNQLLIGALAVANGLAALIAFSLPAPVSLPLALLVALLWMGGMAALAPLFPRLRATGQAAPSWLKPLREVLVRHGPAVPRLLLVVGLVSALLGQSYFFFQRESPQHLRNGVLFWCVAVLSFGLLLWMEKLVQVGPSGEGDNACGGWNDGDEGCKGYVDVSDNISDDPAPAAKEPGGTAGARGNGWPSSPWVLVVSLLLAFLAQSFVASSKNVGLGIVLYAVALFLFLGGLARRLPRLSPKHLLVGVGVGLVALATYWSHTRAWVSPIQVAFGVLLPWVSGIVVAVIGLSGPRTWKLTTPGWRRDAVAMAVLLAIALILRMVGLGQIPDVMSGDEAAMAMEAQRILDGNPSNPFRVAVIGRMSHPALFFYMESVALRLFGWNLFGLRFTAALLGSLGVPAVYLLARKIFGRKVAWIAALFMAGWGLPLHFSRLGLNNSADPFFGAVVMWGLHSGLVYGRRRGFIVSGLALGMSLYFYHGTHLLILLVAATLLISGIKRLRQHWRGLLIFAFCFLLSFGPLLATFIIDPGQFQARYSRQPLFSEGGVPAGLLLRNLGRAAFAFVYTRDTGYFYRPDTPLLGLLSGSLFVLGLGLAVWRWREARYAVLLVWIGLTIVVGGWLFDDPPHYQRYLIAAPAVCLLVGRAAAVGVRRAARLWDWSPVWKRILPMIPAVVLLIATAGYYFGVYTPAGGFHWDRNTVIADRTAHLMVDLGPDYTTYFFGTTYMPLNAFRNLVRFFAPDAYWVDVLETPADFHFVEGERKACFIVIPERTDDLALLRERFPGGEEWTVLARDGKLLFTVYRVDEVSLQQMEEGDIS